ncbi:uncharacterized protein LOC103717118 isoform X2 [Phoenix dactylifera]|uniref:Uncharacterized protein LOC103717118 isoform X2 n=1 Tax=Phoenix dactylifera TaxID=42345 RepID=A0A8B9AGC0_PHODC|nr:uncharacterized protein LOC103717118 isoform X2 [Phoenix dactylifera]
MPSKEKKDRKRGENMGKGTDLWDDSALINAFDHAMATYKAMHTEEYQGNFLKEGKQTTESNKDEPVHAEKTTEQIEPDDDINNINSGAAEVHVSCCSNEVTAEDLPDQKDNLGMDFHATESYPYSSGALYTDGKIDGYSVQQSTEFNELLRQYYELEEKKQKIVEQLQDTNYLNYQTTAQSFTSQMHDVPASNACNASEYARQHPCSLCSCHYLAVPISACAIGGLSSEGYGCCPPWIASCSVSPANLFPGAQCPAQSGTCSIGASCSMDPAKQSTYADDEVVKAGMIAAERTINSMKTEISATSNICEDFLDMAIAGKVPLGKEMGKDKSENSGIQERKGSESIGPETDLACVLNAWYSAGFHTGRYLLEQSRRNSHQ